MIDFHASERHFVDHLAPVWCGLPAEARGRFVVPAFLVDHAAVRGVVAEVSRVPHDRVTVVASYGDLKRARRDGAPVVYLEHGAGQTYNGQDSGSYIGASDRDGVVRALLPGPWALTQHRRHHPTIPAVAVGCPKLDRWVGADHGQAVGVTFHWDCWVSPETRSAWRHHQSGLRRVAQKVGRDRFVGHTHPRADRRMARWCRRYALDYTDDLADVFARCAVLVADNTSAMYEFAALGRPVVALNAPWYRRDVEHGLRFWSLVPGEQVDDAQALPAAVLRALTDDPWQDERRRVVAEVYANMGTATPAAVAALLEVA